MATPQLAKRRDFIDRLADWALDHEGDIYGDERARLRWYEGIALTASVQWILVPWVLAACAWFAPVSAAPALWCIAAAFIVPMYLSLIYGFRRGVDVLQPSKSRKAKLVQVITTAPMALFLVGMTLGADLRSGRSWSDISAPLVGGLVGGCVGLAGAAFVVHRSRARKEHRKTRDDDGELD